MDKGWSLFRLFQPNTTLLGVDVSCAQVKMLELEKTAGQFLVKNYASKALPKGAVVQEVVKKPEAVTEAIQETWASFGTDLKDVAIAVPDSSVITKMLHLTSGLSAREIENQLYLDAPKYIPYPLDEVNMDFEVRGVYPKNPDLMEVLLVASRSAHVASRVDVVTAAGLLPKVVDVEAYAIERACQMLKEQWPDQGEHKTIAVMDIGAAVSNLVVLYNLSTIFTREESFGGDQFMAQSRPDLALEEDTSTREKEYLPLSDAHKATIVQQIQRALQFFYSASHERKIDHIVLSGGIARVPHLADLVSEQLSISTTVANPFLSMQIASHIDKERLMAHAPALMTSCGLALRSFAS